MSRLPHIYFILTFDTWGHHDDIVEVVSIVMLNLSIGSLVSHCEFDFVTKFALTDMLEEQ